MGKIKVEVCIGTACHLLGAPLLIRCLEELPSSDQLRTASVSGVKNCLDLLRQLQTGRAELDFIEGMGCENGCIGGPGTLVDSKPLYGH